MIFVTVGTHEQPFDRLVREIDRLKSETVINDDVFVQTGYSIYKPESCQYKDFIRFDEMTGRMKEADIVITHGGTGSIMLVLYHQKIPLVVPRQKRYHEHIDDHQVLFCKTMEAKNKIIALYEIENLGPVINNYCQLAQHCHEQVKEELGLQSASVKASIFARKLNDLFLQLVKK